MKKSNQKQKEKKEESVEQIQGEELDNQEFITKLDIAKHIVNIHTPGINENVKDDFTLAYYNNEKDKQFVIDITSDAYFSKFVYDNLINALDMKIVRWEHDYPNAKTDIALMKKQRELIEKIKAKTFDSLMKKPYMMNIMNRNVNGNKLTRLIGGLEEEEQEHEDILQGTEQKGFMASVKKILKGNKKTGRDDVNMYESYEFCERCGMDTYHYLYNGIIICNLCMNGRK